MQQIELSPAVHLAFDQLELGYLALSLTVRPSRDDCGPDGRDVAGNTVGKRGDQTAASLVEPRIKLAAALRGIISTLLVGAALRDWLT